MTDWTIVWTTIGASATSGGIAYGIARLTARTTIRQVEAENERLQIGHEEEHRRHRQGVYHDFLDAVVGFESMIRAAVPRLESGELFTEPWEPVRKELADLLHALRHHVDGLALFGSAEVRQLAEEFDLMYLGGFETDLRVALLSAAPEVAGDATRAALDLFEGRIGNMRHGYDTLLRNIRDAMRRDVDPGA